MGHEARPEGTPSALTVVLPVYNPGHQLAGGLQELTAFLATLPVRSEIVLVDDGSSDGALKQVGRHISRPEPPRVRVLRYGKNRGKGYAVRQGVAAATGDYVVYTDIDLAYPPSEIATVLAELRKGGLEVVAACRTHPDSRYLLSPAFFRYLYTRHLASRLFNRLVRVWLRLDAGDTQAGLKGFTRGAARAIFSRARIDGFTFDVEVLCLARKLGFRTQEIPVRYRYETEPTTVQFLRDGIQALVDLVKIRWWLLTGRYDRPPTPQVALQPAERTTRPSAPGDLR